MKKTVILKLNEILKTVLSSLNRARFVDLFDHIRGAESI